jgi:hypothetical protein
MEGDHQGDHQRTKTPFLLHLLLCRCHVHCCSCCDPNNNGAVMGAVIAQKAVWRRAPLWFVCCCWCVPFWCVCVCVCVCVWEEGGGVFLSSLLWVCSKHILGHSDPLLRSPTHKLFPSSSILWICKH